MWYVQRHRNRKLQRLACQLERAGNAYPLARRLGKARRVILGDVKPVGEGVCEMCELFGPGWPMYYVEQKGSIIFMLGGGDKSSQAKDIERAIRLAKEL